MLGRVQCSWLTTRIPSSRKWAIPGMCSPVEDKRCGHVNQEKALPRVYSTGRGPALHHLLLPRRPGLAVGLLSVLSLPAGKAASRGAGRGLSPWPRFLISFQAAQWYNEYVSLFVFMLSSAISNQASLCPRGLVGCFWRLLSWRCARPLGIASSSFSFFFVPGGAF